MVINVDSSKQSRARLQLQPTPGAWASPCPTSGSGAPPRPASGSGTPSRLTPQARLLTEAHTVTNHYGLESTTQGQTSSIV